MAQRYKFTKKYHIVHLQWVNFVVCKLCCHKAVGKKKQLRKKVKTFLSLPRNLESETLFVQQILSEAYHMPGMCAEPWATVLNQIGTEVW